MQCAYKWIEAEEVQDMSRILKVILYQTAESLGSPRWELRRIANQVSNHQFSYTVESLKFKVLRARGFNLNYQ